MTTPEVVVRDAIRWYGANPTADVSPTDVIVTALRDAGLLVDEGTSVRPTYDEVNAWLREHHNASVGTGPQRVGWWCSCGAGSAHDTTPGRARAGRDRHLQAVKRAYLATFGKGR